MSLNRNRLARCCAFASGFFLVGCSSLGFGTTRLGHSTQNNPQETESLDTNVPIWDESGGALAARLADPTLPSGNKPPSTRRALPELEFPEVDLDQFPIVTPAVEVETDLWQRLRSGFRLSNLEEDPGRVEKFAKWYASHPKYFDRLAERAYWFLPYVLDAVEQRGIPAEVAVLPAIESAFRPDVTSRSRAAGMWQFIGATGRRFGLRQDWWMDARRDLAQSTRAALDYLEYLVAEFDGDWEFALAAYNAGEGNISRAIKRNKANNKPTTYSHLELRRETSEYLPRLFAVRNVLLDPAKYGITLPPLENKSSIKIIDLKHQTDISVAASFLTLSRKQLHFLNLGYKRGITPPNGPHTLVVPIDEADQLVASLSTLSPTERMQWAHHKVRKGEYLGKIAVQHGVTVQSIQRANDMRSVLIHPGQELKIPLSTGAFQFAGPALRSSENSTRKHLVSRGDTLWKISRKYRVDLDKILRWNQLSRKATIHPGQSIIVNH